MKDNKIVEQIKNLDNMILRNFITENEISKLPILTPTQIRIIQYILRHKEEEIYQKDLETILNLRRATVSGVLKTMEKNNLIERQTDSKDTRTKKILLKEKSKEIFSLKSKKLKQIENIIVKDISKEDLKTFSKVIEIMKNNLKQTKQFS